MEEDRQRKLLLFEGGGVADLGQVEDWGSTPSTSRPPGLDFYLNVKFSNCSELSVLFYLFVLRAVFEPLNWSKNLTILCVQVVLYRSNPKQFLRVETRFSKNRIEA